ncbi:hypothetical protein [Rhodonellum sp.]|uniref:hypothetical protein n=1 Tax=Rhodonellum sp. TaxID=2231180 RepID=UPI00271CAC99|nr:hypothetical protein [Rhodonellum sp.]MDO9554530.1 hypothetical protein [Rhodonellum sp.]
MKNYVFALLMGLFLTIGFTAQAVEKIEPVSTYLDNSDHMGIMELAALKVAIYSIPIENRIILVKDPKNFIISAKRHGMEYIMVKPSDKGDYWELLPLFYTEKSFSLKPNSDDDPDKEGEEKTYTVLVKDFLRYN